MDKHTDKRNGSQCTCSDPELCATAKQLKLVMSWSVNYSLSQLDSSAKEEALVAEDFIGVHKVTVSMEHFRVSCGMPASFQFKEYCPRVFAHLRREFGSSNVYSVDGRGGGGSCSEDFRAAWTVQLPAWDSDSRGHSSSRFLRSADGAFFAKTIERSEAGALKRMLSSYWNHVTDCQTDTLLPQLMALYRITMSGSKFYILFMRSVFNSGHPLIRKYDLKGSRVARRATTADTAGHAVPTLKDLDFIRAADCLNVGPEVKSAIMERLRRDVAFLERHNIMDYSLLVGVHEWADVSKEDRQTDCSDQLPSAEAQQFNRFLIKQHLPSDVAEPSPSSAGRPTRFYSIGMIDILTDYGLVKRAACACKRMRYPAAGGVDNAFSTVPPEQYAKRFLSFADSCMQ
ncbi:hypothetical protein BOX15_Mlig024671g1 [Macrostomum lignano]|uniref:PIPK domain-containing protein n=1 Tax=Macrostomum lignano TaxID=282301 RepID=A0A267GDW5_9PLAT|nr:hypothetical protein BOX15_Mlig024671g1 [Macrostomum lignano]